EAIIKSLRKRLTPDAAKALTDVKAYPGGPGQSFWHLHCLDNIDKHRLLLTVTSQNRFHSMSPAEIANIRHKFLGVLSGIPEINDPRMFLKSCTPRLSLGAGDVLDIFPIAEVHENMHFPIELAFGEPDFVKGKPIIEMLHQIANGIHNVLMLFDNQ